MERLGREFGHWAFIATTQVFVVLMLIAGLVLDMSALLAAKQRATLTLQAATRAGARGLDWNRYLADGSWSLDDARALSEAIATLAESTSYQEGRLFAEAPAVESVELVDASAAAPVRDPLSGISLTAPAILVSARFSVRLPLLHAFKDRVEMRIRAAVQLDHVLPAITDGGAGVD